MRAVNVRAPIPGAIRRRPAGCRGRAHGWLGIAIALVSAAACGKKGPPLPPLVRIPAAVEAMSATRVGHDVYVTLTIPSANIDKFTPADISRVEVYGYTGTAAPPRGRWVELGTLVATVPVAPPPPREDERPALPAERRVGALQGESVTVRDTLTRAELVQGKLPPTPAADASGRKPGAESTEPQSPRSTGEPRGALPHVNEAARKPVPPLRRFYLAYPWSERGRVGPPSDVIELPLESLPDPPPSVSLTYSETSISVAWEPSAGLIGFLLERPLPDEPPPVELETSPLDQPRPPQAPLAYNVYRTRLPDPTMPPPDADAPGAQPWNVPVPAPVNPAPVAALTFADTLEFGRIQCYTVRAIRGVGQDARIGDPSPTACIRPVDTFPPAVPQGLAAVASEDGIGLIWDPNSERDLGGYVILRGNAGDATLQPLTPTPVTEARYRDTDVRPGTRYVYAVIAVDNRFPVPNMSAASTTVEETAR